MITSLLFLLLLPLSAVFFHYKDISFRQESISSTQSNEFKLLNAGMLLTRALHAQTNNLWEAINHGPGSIERQNFINLAQLDWENFIEQIEIIKKNKLRIEDQIFIDQVESSLSTLKYTLNKLISLLESSDKKIINDSKVIMISEYTDLVKSLSKKSYDYAITQQNRYENQMEKEHKYIEEQMESILGLAMAYIIIACTGWYLIRRKFTNLNKKLESQQDTNQKLIIEMENDSKILSQLLLIDNSQKKSIEEVYQQLEVLKAHASEQQTEVNNLVQHLKDIKELYNDVADLSKTLVLYVKEISTYPNMINEAIVHNLNIAKMADGLQNVVFQTQLLLFGTQVEIGERKTSRSYLVHVAQELDKIMKNSDLVSKNFAQYVHESNLHQADFLQNTTLLKNNFKEVLLLLGKELNTLNSKIESTNEILTKHQVNLAEKKNSAVGLCDYVLVLKTVDEEAHKGLKKLSEKHNLRISSQVQHLDLDQV